MNNNSVSQLMERAEMIARWNSHHWVWERIELDTEVYPTLDLMNETAEFVIKCLRCGESYSDEDEAADAAFVGPFTWALNNVKQCPENKSVEIPKMKLKPFIIEDMDEFSIYTFNLQKREDDKIQINIASKGLIQQYNNINYNQTIFTKLSRNTAIELAKAILKTCGDVE